MSNKVKLILIPLIYYLALLLIGYIFIPSLNIHSVPSLIYMGLYFVYPLSLIIYLLKDKFLEYYKKKNVRFYKAIRCKNKNFTFVERPIKEKYSMNNILFRVGGVIIVFILALSFVMQIAGTKLFCSKLYASQLTINDGTTEEFHEEFQFNGDDVLLPIIDKDLAFKIAQSKLLTYGSQYTIDYDNFTIISVNRNGVDELVRIAPLEYSGFFVALNKINSGSIGYIEVNVITKEAKLVEVEGGMKYMPSALLNKDLERHIRFNYPTALFEQMYFEIDDNNKPYWVVPTYTNEIALFSGKNPTGVITVDPVTGETNRYSLEKHEEPSWIDRVVVVELVQDQASNAFKYKNGFFNATFGQKKDVFTVSDGYNYFIKNGQTYYVSCITSPNDNDQTSIGFVTINLKTKEAKKYFIPGITEMRAREIAMQHEDVKAQKLEATWPILIDYQGVPTYFMVLKNDVQVMRYVFIDVESGTKMVLKNSLEEAKIAYEKLLNNNEDQQIDITGLVSRVRFDQENVYFIVEGYDKYFVCENDLNINTMFLQPGDQVNIKCVEFDEYYFVKDLTLI